MLPLPVNICVSNPHRVRGLYTVDCPETEEFLVELGTHEELDRAGG